MAPDEPTTGAPAARQLKKPCRSSSAPAAMTEINTSFLNVSCAILSRICCPTYMPIPTGNIAAVEIETSTELAAGRQKNCQQAGGNDEIQLCLLCERLSAQSLCKQKYENKRSRHRCDASQNPAEKSECDAGW